MGSIYILQAAQCVDIANSGSALIGKTVIARQGPCRIGLSNLYVKESGATSNVSVIS